MSKKGKKVIIFLIIIILILLTLSVKTIMDKQGSVLEFSNLEDLDSKILNFDINDYPSTPEEVCKVYLEGYKYIYNDFMDNKEMVSTIIEKQRNLMSSSILENNLLESQKKYVFNNLEYLKKSKFKIEDIVINEFKFDNSSKNKGYFDVVKKGNNGEEYNFKYYLAKNNEDNWQIIGWERYNIELEP